MAKPSRTLEILAKKLGLSEEDKVLSKAAELERLLQTKSTASTITDTAKTVICLELAATYYRVEFDQKSAIKSSGLKGSSYINSKKIIENALELNNSKLTIAGLCLALQCSVQELAEQILEEYRKNSKMELDMDLPQYVCMAVYQACRINKIKMPKSKIIDKSQLKPGQWSKLDAEWTKFTDEKFAAVVKKKRGRPAKNAVIDDAEEKMDIDTELTTKQEEMEPQIEPYEDWKTRILEAAYKELEILKQNLTTSKQKITSSKQKESTQHLEVLNKQKQTPTKQKVNSRESIGSANMKLDFESPNTRSSSKQKHTPSKQGETPSKLKENSIKSIVNASKNLDFECSPNTRSSSKQSETLVKQKETPSKLKETPNKPKETPSKLKETPSKLKENNKPTGSAGKEQLDFDFTPRRSPRKTPQKFEPYKGPVKTGGVRLLFPL